MTLSSQMARTDRMSGSWGGSSRRRTPGPALTYGLAAGGVLLLAVIAWTFSGPSTTAAADGSGATPTGATPTGATPTGATPTGDAATPPTPPAAQLPAGTPLANDSRQPAPAPQPAPRQPAASLEMGTSGPSTAKTGTVDIPTLPTSIPAATPSPRHTPTLVPTSELKPGPTGSAAAAGAGADAAKPAGAQPASHPNPAPGAAPTNPPANPPANPAATPPAPATPAGPAPSIPADVQARFTAAERAMKENRLVDARQLLNGALLDPRTPESDREGLRRWMAQINDTLVFSPTIAANDPLVTTYTIAKGDSLERIAARQGVATDWRFIQRVNNLSAPGRISVGQKLKLVRGPFHAVVHKGAFRMDIFAGEPNLAGQTPKGGVGGVQGADPGWIYIRSFPVGLGTQGSTPTGSFVVRPRSKLINPAWTNPRTGEKFAKDDPKNPIGERWMGLEGIDDSTRALAAYGVHGTIDPQSIGREMSMGCVRLADADVDIVYELLTEGVSVVRIVP
jgi:hypothetical protein